MQFSGWCEAQLVSLLREVLGDDSIVGSDLLEVRIIIFVVRTNFLALTTMQQLGVEMEKLFKEPDIHKVIDR